MKIKHTHFERDYIPDIFVMLEDGNVIKNRENDPEDQIKTEITYANTKQRKKYLSFLTQYDKEEDIGKAEDDYKYNVCIRTHVDKIIGLEELKIHNGEDLMEHEPMPLLHALIEDLFHKICYLKKEDILSEKK